MVVVPRADLNSPNFQLERVVHFAFMATNKYEATEVFRAVCNSYQLILDTIHKDLVA